MPRIKTKSDEDILATVLAVIAARGLTSFSLMDVSKATGLAPATLLQRFKSKENLLVTAISFANEKMKAHFFSVVERTRIAKIDPIESIIEILLDLAADLSTPEMVASGLDIFKKDIIDKELNDLAREHFLIRRQVLEEILEEAKHQLILLEHVNIKKLVDCLESIWQGTIMLWAIQVPGELKPVLRSNLMMLLDGYCRKK